MMAVVSKMQSIMSMLMVRDRHKRVDRGVRDLGSRHDGPFWVTQFARHGFIWTYRTLTPKSTGWLDDDDDGDDDDDNNDLMIWWLDDLTWFSQLCQNCHVGTSCGVYAVYPTFRHTEVSPKTLTEMINRAAGHLPNAKWLVPVWVEGTTDRI